MYQEGLPQDKDDIIRHLTTRVQRLTVDKDEQLRSLKQLLELKDETIATLQQELQSLRTHKDSNVSSQQQVQATQARQQTTDLVWETLPDAPVDMWASSSAVVGGKAYFLSNGCKNVYDFDLQRKRWSAMPKHPIADGIAIVCIDDMLTSVGGYINNLLGGKYSNKLYTFIGNRGGGFPTHANQAFDTFCSLQ